MKKMSAGSAIGHAIAREGVEQVFTVPGESLLTILDGLYDQSSVNVVAARHENGASYMALGYAIASGKPGVCIAQRAPGSTNLSLGLHCASQDSAPVVAFVTQVGSSSIGREAHQETDLARMLQPHCKTVLELMKADRAVELTERAFQISKEGRPGVVAVVMPQDLLLEEAAFNFAAVSQPAIPGLPADDAAEVCKLLQAARCPALLVGRGVGRAAAAAEIIMLAELLGCPILSWHMGVVPDHHPNRVDVAGLRSKEQLSKVDLFLVIGSRLHEDASLLYTIPPRGTPWVHIDMRPGVAYAPEPPILSIVANARRAALALIAELRNKPVDKHLLHERQLWVKSWRNSESADSTIPEPHSSSPIHPDHVGRALAEVFPADTAVSVDVGNFVYWVRRHWRHRPANMFFESAAGSMGSGFSTAIGVQLARPDKLVVGIAGDGGFMMSLPELETAARLRLPIICVVFNNNLYGTIRWQQELHFPKRSIATEITNPDFAEVARSFGAFGERVDNVDELVPSLKRAMGSRKLAVLNVMTDPNELVPGVTLSQLRGAVHN